MLERWIPYLKGTTVMPDGSRPQAPYQRISKAEFDLAEYASSVASSVDEECANGACPVR
jgi:ribonucleoside-triphosphate reductase